MRKPWYSFLYVRSPITKILYGILAVIISMGALVVQQVLEEPRMQAQTGNWDGRSIEKGAEIFANNCSNCHGPDGKGLPGVAPALNSRYFFTQRLEDIGYTGSVHDYVSGTVGAGRPSKAVRQWAQMMPTWGARYGGPLRDDQVEHVTNFVLNWEEDALKQSWDPASGENLDPWQPFQDGPSRAETGTLTHTVGTLGVAAVLPEQVAGGIVTPTQTTEEAPVAQSPAQLFVSMGCAGCHLLGDIGVGVTGPDQNLLPEVAGTRVPGQDAETYVYTSIVDPNAHVVEGYQPGIMPANFSERMSEEEIQAMVDWLLDPNRSYE
jgi:mono/diheme cytochrome c family protein